MILPDLTQQDIVQVHHHSSTLEQLLNGQGPDFKDPVHLMDSTVDVRVFESDQYLFYRVTFPDKLICGQDFIKLLTNSKPKNPRYSVQTNTAIEADWTLVDKSDKRSKQLVKIHEDHLEPYWTEFLDHHRIPFLEAIFAETPELTKRFLKSHLNSLIAKENTVAYFPDALTSGVYARSLLFHNYDQFEEWLSENSPDVTKESLEVMPIREVKSLLKKLPDELKSLLIGLGAFNYSKIIVDADGEPAIIDNGGYGRRFYSIEHEGKGIVKIEYRNSWMRAKLVGKSYRELDSFVADESENAITPLMVWIIDKQSNQRIYLSSGFPHSLSECVSQNPDALLGLVVAAYLSPEQKSALPHWIRLEDQGVQQRMLEAQVPLLMSLYREKLMSQSPLFPIIEQVYQK